MLSFTADALNSQQSSHHCSQNYLHFHIHCKKFTILLVVFPTLTPKRAIVHIMLHSWSAICRHCVRQQVKQRGARGKYVGNLDYWLQHSRVDREDAMDRGRWKKLIKIG